MLSKLLWENNVTIASNPLKYDNVDWLFGFHQDEYECVLKTDI